MKILFVTPVVPWPLDRGNRIRIYNFLKELSKNNSVIMVCAVDRFYIGIDEAKKELEKYCIKIYFVTLLNKYFIFRVILKIISELQYYIFGKIRAEFYYNLWPIKRLIYKLLKSNNFDLIFNNYWYTAINPIIKSNLPKICDTHDIIWEYHKRKLEISNYNFIVHFFESKVLKKLFKRESEILNNYNLLICVTEKDIKTLKEILKVKTECIYIPTIRDKDKFKYYFNRDNKNIILFYGALHSPMNIDAAKYLAIDIFSNIREKIPLAELVIAGSGITEDIIELQKINGISVIGYINDLQELFKKAKVLLLPLRFGSGIKGRVLEAMEAGLPVIGTDVTFEGIPIINNEHAIIANNKDDIVFWTIKLLENENIRKNISEKARMFVENYYKWDNSYSKLSDYLLNKIKNYKK